jgi:hypothetical protein
VIIRACRPRRGRSYVEGRLRLHTGCGCADELDRRLVEVEAVERGMFAGQLRGAVIWVVPDVAIGGQPRYGCTRAEHHLPDMASSSAWSTAGKSVVDI